MMRRPAAALGYAVAPLASRNRTGHVDCHWFRKSAYAAAIPSRNPPAQARQFRHFQQLLRCTIGREVSNARRPAIADHISNAKPRERDFRAHHAPEGAVTL
jgi:hypothetical protein